MAGIAIDRYRRAASVHHVVWRSGNYSVYSAVIIGKRGARVNFYFSRGHFNLTGRHLVNTVTETNLKTTDMTDDTL